MKNRMVTVIDLGSTKVAGLIASEGDNGEMRIHGTAVVPCTGLRRGIVTDLAEVTRAVGDVIRILKEETGHECSSVSVGVTGSHTEGLMAQGYVPIYPKSRSITREDVLQVIRHSRQVQLAPDREQIQAIPREFRIDGQRGIQRPVGMVGSKLEVVTYVVTGQSSAVQNIEKAITDNGKRVDHMVLESLASGLGVLTHEEMELGTAVADIGGGSTDIAVFSGGSIAYSAVVPIGGVLVTSDLSKLLKTSVEDAERLKMIYGAASSQLAGDREAVQVRQIGQDIERPLQRKVLCEIIESRMREIAVLVKQQLEKSGYTGLLPGGLVLTGGGAMLRGADMIFNEVLQHMHVRSVEPDLPHFDVAGHSFATAVGMARFAIECGTDELVPAGGSGDWKDTIRTLWSIIKR